MHINPICFSANKSNRTIRIATSSIANTLLEAKDGFTSAIKEKERFEVISTSNGITYVQKIGKRNRILSAPFPINTTQMEANSNPANVIA